MVYQMYEQKGIKGGKPYLSEEEFAQKFGTPPWDFVNSILKRLFLPYEVNNPMNTTRETSFIFKLRHSEKGFEINTNDLSTGEKTLMSLALAIYNTTGEGHRTDLLILDEPDAPLHPSMYNLMLQILQEDILKKQGIPVIIPPFSDDYRLCSQILCLKYLPKIKFTALRLFGFHRTIELRYSQFKSFH
jgi:ABC-type multidrug transport system ATPase subunit